MFLQSEKKFHMSQYTCMVLLCGKLRHINETKTYIYYYSFLKGKNGQATNATLNRNQYVL